jgi:hypothetical protein
MTDIVQQHPILDTVAIYLALGFVGTMPPKGTQWTIETLYDWLYDFMHVAINFIPPSRRPAIDVIPIQPVAPAQHLKEK